MSSEVPEDNTANLAAGEHLSLKGKSPAEMAAEVSGIDNMDVLAGYVAGLRPGDVESSSTDVINDPTLILAGFAKQNPANFPRAGGLRAKYEELHAKTWDSLSVPEVIAPDRTVPTNFGQLRGYLLARGERGFPTGVEDRALPASNVMDRYNQIAETINKLGLGKDEVSSLLDYAVGQKTLSPHTRQVLGRVIGGEMSRVTKEGGELPRFEPSEMGREPVDWGPPAA